jgi:branched-chain amino acid transport system ATP-binding protein
MPALRLDGIETSYGGVRALRGVSLEVQAERIAAILGSNGAGKTTILRTISGLVTPARGEVLLDGRPITGLAPQRIVALGVSQVPERREIFPELTVAEHLMLGAYLRSNRAEIRADIARMYDLFPVLASRQRQLASTLSGGEQQMLVIARALMARPKVLLLDEPSLGLAPTMIERIFDAIRALPASHHCAILLVEQNTQIALDVADFAYVLETGAVALAGPAADLARDPQVQQAYLGGNVAEV